MKYKSSQYCPNCHFPLPYKAKFCARCGQKNDDGRISLRALFKLVWFRVLHLESRSLHFMWLLFIPGYVTTEFFNGHRKRYPQPIRFFFIVMFLFLFTINHQSSSGTGWKAGTSYNGIRLEPETADSLKNLNFYELGKRYVEFERMRQEFDSLPEAYRQPVVKLAIDSLLQRTYGKDANTFRRFWEVAAEADPTQRNSADSLDLNLGGKTLTIATLDAFRYDAETIAARYNISRWSEKLFLRQGLKTLQEPEALLNAYLGSLAWTLLAVIALMAGVLTLFFLKQGRYYVEHFIFLLNEHSAIFLIITVALLINACYSLGWVWIPVVGWLVISPIFAMRRFYGQGWAKTLLKWFLFFIVYVIGFAVLFILCMIIVFMIF